MSLMTKRIIKELEQLRNDPPSSFVAQCINNNLYEWHFTIRGPENSDYDEGIYHGKIVKPPNIFFLTPNGRFEVKTKICLNITKFHPENWNPSWTIRTMVEGIIQHFHVKDFAVGSIQYTSNQIKSLALASHKWECDICGPIIKCIVPKGKQVEQFQSEKKEQHKVDQNENSHTQEAQSKYLKENEKKVEKQKNDLPEDDKEIPDKKAQVDAFQRLIWKTVFPDTEKVHSQLKIFTHKNFNILIKFIQNQKMRKKFIDETKDDKINKMDDEIQKEFEQANNKNKYSSQIKLIGLVLLSLIFGIVFVNFGEFVEQTAKDWLLFN
ncbi:unnamed protein product (macronuclear) [Paramecium tetraurelia]|uniref:UBC core domain-containing protein n=1 Tax=Paramecium tetraurelia TaxID=5888 RepID=A0BW19_PARTE|nr:uncharacterized protein GSPATT00032588001 [Paramecium tetraurelia]CAK62736.1 unnamed protein product [Paramecium tetraurelia]|eukprot:XP_001430134.1 hypothetical protein (macronuclear) [Paramecium tetraurelia strain d4-2]